MPEKDKEVKVQVVKNYDPCLIVTVEPNNGATSLPAGLSLYAKVTTPNRAVQNEETYQTTKLSGSSTRAKYELDFTDANWASEGGQPISWIIYAEFNGVKSTTPLDGGTGSGTINTNPPPLTRFINRVRKMFI